MPNEYEDITPEDSVVPIYLIPETEPLFEVPEFTTPDEMIAAQQDKLNSAVAKLKKIGLTEEEAKVVVGL